MVHGMASTSLCKYTSLSIVETSILITIFLQKARKSGPYFINTSCKYLRTKYLLEPPHEQISLRLSQKLVSQPHPLNQILNLLFTQTTLAHKPHVH